MKVSHLSQCIKDISSFQSSVDDPSLSKPADQITLLDIYKAVEGEKPLLHLDTHTNPDCGVGINIQLSLQGFYNEIQKNAEEKMNTITLQDIINTYYQRTSMQNDLQNII